MNHPRTGVWMVVGAGLAALLAGCVHDSQGKGYTAPYRRVDRTSPDYQAAVATTIAAEQAKGKSAKDAEKAAVSQVTREFVAKEKTSREEQVAPLVAALADFERPRGCWAYTLTSTRIAGDRTTVTIERFNPYEPEERLWTLVSIDGWVPTEKGQADYRKARLRKWKKQQERSAKQKPASVQAGFSALHAQIEVSAPDAAGQVTFSFEREPIHLTLIGDSPHVRETYAVDPAFTRVLRHSKANLAPTSMLGIHIDAFESTTEYQIVTPDLPPFPARTVLRYRLRLLGKDTGNVTLEAVYSDYRKVKCYDDRFSVKLGELNVMDVLPE